MSHCKFNRFKCFTVHVYVDVRAERCNHFWRKCARCTSNKSPQSVSVNLHCIHCCTCLNCAAPCEPSAEPLHVGCKANGAGEVGVLFAHSLARYMDALVASAALGVVYIGGRQHIHPPRSTRQLPWPLERTPKRTGRCNSDEPCMSTAKETLPTRDEAFTNAEE